MHRCTHICKIHEYRHVYIDIVKYFNYHNNNIIKITIVRKM